MTGTSAAYSASFGLRSAFPRSSALCWWLRASPPPSCSAHARSCGIWRRCRSSAGGRASRCAHRAPCRGTPVAVFMSALRAGSVGPAQRGRVSMSGPIARSGLFDSIRVASRRARRRGPRTMVVGAGLGGALVSHACLACQTRWSPHATTASAAPRSRFARSGVSAESLTTVPCAPAPPSPHAPP